MPSPPTTRTRLPLLRQSKGLEWRSRGRTKKGTQKVSFQSKKPAAGSLAQVIASLRMLLTQCWPPQCDPPICAAGSSTSAAVAATHGGVGVPPHEDEAATTARAVSLPTKPPQRIFSLFSPDVLCEVVLLGEEREQIAAQLNWTPSANSDSDGEGEGEEEDDAGDDNWLPSNKGKASRARGAPMSDADPDSIGDEQAADADHERGLDLMSWLQCVLHSSSPDRMWGCWCGTQPYATFRVVRRHIREAHAGIVDPPSPVAASSCGPGRSDQLAEDASGTNALLQPTAMRSNVRVQLPPPLMQGRQVRTQ